MPQKTRPPAEITEALRDAGSDAHSGWYLYDHHRFGKSKHSKDWGDCTVEACSWYLKVSGLAAAPAPAAESQEATVYDERWAFADACPHGLRSDVHCDTCCVDIGDAERQMRFDAYDEEPEMSATEEWAAGEAANDWGGS